MKTTADHLYQVSHPDLGSVQATAQDRCAAIVAAAKGWGQRWTQIAKDCTVEDQGVDRRYLCRQCGKEWLEKPGYCPRCARDRQRAFAQAARAGARERRDRR